MLARFVRDKPPWSDYISSSTLRLVMNGASIDSVLERIEPLAAITTVQQLEATPLARRLHATCDPDVRHKPRSARLRITRDAATARVHARSASCCCSCSAWASG